MLVLLKKSNVKLVVLAMIVALGVFLTGCQSEDVVAEVNGEEISVEDFMNEYEISKKGVIAQFGDDILDEVGPDGQTLRDSIKNTTVENLILQRVIEQEATKMGIEITEEELDSSFAEFIESEGGEENYNNYIEENGISDEYMRSMMAQQLMLIEYQTAFIEETEISDERAQEFFEENKESLVAINASHILLSEEEEAKEVLARIENGEDFAEIAKEESLDSGSAVNGGNLGYFSKGKMIPEFDEAAFALEEGEISDLVKTDIGYHIIKLEDKKDNYDELKDKIINMMKHDEFEETVTQLRENADVKIYEEVLAEIDSEEAKDAEAEDQETEEMDEVDELEEIDEPEETEEIEETEEDKKGN